MSVRKPRCSFCGYPIFWAEEKFQSYWENFYHSYHSDCKRLLDTADDIKEMYREQARETHKND